MSVIDLPQPKLGNVTAITLSTPDLETSFEFYQKLGFTELFRSDFPFPLIQISDGALMMMLRKDPSPYLALTYYVKEMSKVVAELEQSGITFSQRPKETDMIQRYIFQSPDNLTISLVSYVDGFVQPSGATMLTMPQADYFNPEKYVNKSCGMFGELAHPVKDLNSSMLFWEKLGFRSLSKNASPYPWAIMSDGLAVVGLHQTKHFSEPAITFFASDMKDKIEKLKANGLTDYKETMGPKNITLTSPEKQHINLFNMGM